MDEQQWTLIQGLGFIRNDSAPSAQVAQLGDIGREPLQEAAPMSSLPVRPTATGTTPPMTQPLRKSCDLCRSRKRKCDGPMASDRAGRCRFCASKGLNECVYSERKSSAPKTRPRSSKPPQQGEINGANRGDDRGMPPGSPPAVSSVESFEVVAIKRCRLSASPATGFVGMQENVFLSDYFECMALLPLTDESEIRSAMVAMMQSILPPNQHGLHGSVQPRCSRMAPLPGRALATNGKQSSLQATAGAAAAAARAVRLRSDAGASTCALWCAVAMGALVHGWPTSSVVGYVGLAREALKECFDVASVGAMRAFTLMAFLSNFIGEPDKFQKYLMFAHGMRRSLPPQDIPKAAIDMLLTADSAVLYSGTALTVDEMEDFCRVDDSTAKPVDSVTHKSDRCQRLINVHHRLDQAFFKDMTDRGILRRPLPPVDTPERGVDEPGRGCDGPAPTETGDDESLTGFGGVVGNGAEDRRKVHRRRGVASEVNPLVTLTVVEGKDPDTPPFGEITQRRLLDELPELERLAADISWPEIKTGVGGLIFNIRICLLHYVRDDLDRAQKSIRRVADILLEWPGLCRFSPWLHTTHCALGSLAKGDCASEYEQFRQAYNPVRPAGEPEAPPLEEWKGMGCICQHVFCRTLFSKKWKKGSTYRGEMRKTEPFVDVLDSSDQSEALWKDGLFDEGLLSLLEEDTAGEGPDVGLVKWGTA